MDASLITPSNLWKIGLAELLDSGTTDQQRLEIENRNMEKFKQLQADFPFLSVTLKYRRTVDARVAPDGREHYLEESATLSLHKVIADLLHAFYKLPEFDDVLSSSSSSLRAIHVQAVGLYGLLRKLCGFVPVMWKPLLWAK